MEINNFCQIVVITNLQCNPAQSYEETDNLETRSHHLSALKEYFSGCDAHFGNY